MVAKYPDEPDGTEEIVKTMHLTEWCMSKLEQGETVVFDHEDKHLVIGMMDRIEGIEEDEERYYVE